MRPAVVLRIFHCLDSSYSAGFAVVGVKGTDCMDICDWGASEAAVVVSTLSGLSTT